MGWFCYFLRSAHTHMLDHLAPNTACVLPPQSSTFFLQLHLKLTSHYFILLQMTPSWQHLAWPPCLKLHLLYHLNTLASFPVLSLSSALSKILCILLNAVDSPSSALSSTPLEGKLQDSRCFCLFYSL